MALLALSLVISLISLTSASVIRIGTKTIPPFIFDDSPEGPLPRVVSKGDLRGFTIDLLKDIFRVLPEDRYKGFNYTLLASNEKGIASLANNTIDIFAAAVTETPERETVVDFVTFDHNAGLRIMVHNDIDASSTINNVILAIFSLQTLIFVAIFLVLMIGVGLLYWASDKICRNPRRNLFPDTLARGFPKALTYSFMTINLKEVPRPQTNCTWIVFIIATLLNLFFTALVTASLTTVMDQSVPQQSITGYNDLTGVNVATVRNSFAHQYMINNGGGMRIITYNDVDAMISGYIARTNGDDAMIYDSPVIQYLKGNDNRFDNSVIVGDIFEPFRLGLVLGNDKTVLHEDIKKAVLELVSLGKLVELRERWFRVAELQENRETSDTLFGSLTILGIVGGIVFGVGIILFIIVQVRMYRQLKEDEAKYGIRTGGTDYVYSDWLDAIMKQDSITQRQQELDKKKKELANTDDKIRDVDDFDAPFEALYQTVEIRRAFLDVIKKLQETTGEIDELKKEIRGSSGARGTLSIVPAGGSTPLPPPEHITPPIPAPQMAPTTMSPLPDDKKGVAHQQYPFYEGASTTPVRETPSAGFKLTVNPPQQPPEGDEEQGFTLRNHEANEGGFDPTGGRK